MLAAFGVDVTDPAVTNRKVRVLLERVPPRARELGQPWTPEAELLAGLIDHVAYLTWVTQRVHGGKPSKPKPVWRPPRTEQRRPERRPERRSAANPRKDQPAARRLSWGEMGRELAGIPGVKVVDGG